MSAPRGSRVAARGRAVRGRGTSTLRGTRGRPGGQPTPTNTGSIPRHKSPPVDDVLRNGSSKLLQPPKQQTIRKTSHTAQHASSSPPPDAPRQNAGALPHRGMDAIYQKLQKSRDQERKHAIRDGFLADPDKPTTLANAITPVGTCQDMCPQFERVERIVQRMVDGAERAIVMGEDRPDEKKMVKRFRRSAAGYDEQLPSDIRPPIILKKTLDYLFNDIIGGAQTLANVHKFIWDRTRGIRNDFSIQQVTKVDDLRIAIDCFERIARFHIVSLHQLSQINQDNGEFDHHQEREQLNNTLLSLMYYYDDSRHKLTSPNEAEFRAYCIIFEIQDQQPDLEDRVQQWPRSLLRDRRVETALQLYAAAGNTSDEQGPLRPRNASVIAQANPGRFWSIVSSTAVSYTMACVAEIYFDLIRRTSLEAIWKAFKGKRGGAMKIEDWGLDALASVLRFDDEQQTQTYIEEHGFSIAERADGEPYIDLGSVTSRHLVDSNPRRKQLHSKLLVEPKRLDRLLPAIINGFKASEAHSSGFVENAKDVYVKDISKSHQDSLFVSTDDDDENSTQDHVAEAEVGTKTTANISGTPHNNGTAAGRASQIGTTDTSPLSAIKSADVTAFRTHSTLPPSTLPQTTTVVSPSQQASPFGKPSFLPSSNPISVSRTGLPPQEYEPWPPSQHDSLTATSNLGTEADRSGAEIQTSSDAPQGPAELIDLHNSARPISNISDPFTNGLNVVGTGDQPPQNHSTAAVEAWNHHRTPIEVQHQQPLYAVSPGSHTSVVPHAAPTPSGGLDPIPDLSYSKVTPHSPNSSVLQRDSNLDRLPPAATPRPAAHPIAATSIPNVYQPPYDLKSNHDTNIQTTRGQPALNVHGLYSTPQSAFSKRQDTRRDASDVFPPERGSQAESHLSGLHSVTLGGPVTKSNIIDELSGTIMHEEEGLLQQFIEYTVGPMIVDCVREMRSDHAKKQAHFYRSTLLIKKYGRMWKRNAWKLAVLRRGRERRNNLTRSGSRLVRSTDQVKSSQKASFAETQATYPIAPGYENLRIATAQSQISKRSSLLTMFDERQLERTMFHGSSSKRKRQHSPTGEHEIGRRHREPRHKRATTLAERQQLQGSHNAPSDGRKHKATPLDIPTFKAPSRPGTSTVRGFLHGWADTTRTDYFRLKAIGVDPDTPLVPRTVKKRHGPDRGRAKGKESPGIPSTTASNGNSEPPTIDPAPGLSRSLQPRPIADYEDIDSDEALLNRMRSVRETLSESISWLQTEQSRSQPASSTGSEHFPKETTKQKRLREFTRTPSRTEQRLRLTGGHGLLPKAWGAKSLWRNASGMNDTAIESAWSDYGSTATTSSPPESPVASLDPERGRTHQETTMLAREAGAMKPLTKEAMGSSMDDAIEL